MSIQLNTSPVAGKNILIIGGGDDSDVCHFQKVISLGGNLFIADRESSGWRQRVTKAGLGTFIPFEFSPPLSSMGQAFATTLLNFSKASKNALPSHFDAAFSIDDDYLIFAVHLSTHLGLAFQSIESVQASVDKYAMRVCLEKKGLPSPRFAVVNNEDEAIAVVDNLGLPVVMKPSRGSHSIGVRKVNTHAEVQQIFKEAHSIASAKEQEVLVEQCLVGAEVDVDVIMQDGDVLYSNVVDNWCTGPPYFEERGIELPSSCTPQVQAELRQYTADCLRAVGFSNGVFHVEAIHTAQGPRLLEINPRFGCGPTRELHRAVWDVDFMEQLCIIATGMRAHFEVPEEPLAYCAAPRFPSPHNGVITKTGWLDEAVAKLEDHQALVWCEMFPEGTTVTGVREDTPTNLGFVIVGEKDRKTCRQVVNKWIDQVQVPVKPHSGVWTSSFGLKMP